MADTDRGRYITDTHRWRCDRRRGEIRGQNDRLRGERDNRERKFGRQREEITEERRLLSSFPFLLWGHFVSAAFTKLTPPPSFFAPFIISFSLSPFIWPLPHSPPLLSSPPPCSHHAWLGPGHLLPLQQGCTISDQQGNCCSLHAAGFRCADALSVTLSLCVCCHAHPGRNNWEILKDNSTFISHRKMLLQFLAISNNHKTQLLGSGRTSGQMMTALQIQIITDV